MAYQHQVIEKHGGLFMSHNRLTDRPSGLAVVTEIGRTRPTMPGTENGAGAIVVARTLDGSQLWDSLTGQESIGQVVETIDCEDLDRFIIVGVKRWRELMPRLNPDSGVKLDLAEKRRWTDKTTASGLVLPEPADVEFEGYYATPDEIVALEAMERQLIPSPNQAGQNGTGHYL